MNKNEKAIHELDALADFRSPNSEIDGTDHMRADGILLEFLRAKGHGDVAAAYERVNTRCAFFYE